MKKRCSSCDPEDPHRPMAYYAAKAANFGRIVRKVDGFGRMDADVDHIVTEELQFVDDGCLQRQAGMIGSDCDMHVPLCPLYW